MKFSCTQENLNNGLVMVGHIASRGASLPILSNILLRTNKLGLELTATNLEVAVTTTIRGKVGGEGAITIQSKLLVETIALLPKDHVELEVEGTDLIIKGGKQQTTIRGVAADDYPVIPEVIKVDEVVVASGELAQALSQVIFSINPDEGRPEISGVYTAWTPQGVVLAGTDSYRLAERHVVAEGKLTKTTQVIVPLRAAQEVARIAATTDSEVVIVVGDNQILWKLGETRVVSRLIAGQYPDYQQIIPHDLPTRVVVGRAELTQVVRAAGLFVRSGINDVRLVVDPQSKTIQVSSANSQLGENVGQLELKDVKGEGTEVVFNYRYLLDGLQAVPSGDVAIELKDAKTPGLLRPVGEQAKTYLYIIMPIRQ